MAGILPFLVMYVIRGCDNQGFLQENGGRARSSTGVNNINELSVGPWSYKGYGCYPASPKAKNLQFPPNSPTQFSACVNGIRRHVLIGFFLPLFAEFPGVKKMRKHEDRRKYSVQNTLAAGPRRV
jgi:hypothetical protein